MPILYLLAAIATMLLGALGLFRLRQQGPTLQVKRWSEVTSWIALAFGIVFSIQTLVHPESLSFSHGYFQAGSLQALLIPYILLMGVLVKRFAYHYMQSDAQYAAFFLKIKLLMASLMAFVVINQALLLALTWMLSGWLMYSLIAHTNTRAAINSSKIALKAFLIGDALMLGGILGMAFISKSFYLSDWFLASGQTPSEVSLIFLTCIAVGAFSKTALLPFYQWLPHTLAAPTPVSAVMHAGFVNSGGILLAKLSPLMIQEPVLMMLVFGIGLVSALFGSTVMLVQTDVKRYLTFSTIGQMGFMMMECGLGAFHLAILHLMIHGFFKARLFLSAGTTIQYREITRNVQYQQAQSAAKESILKRVVTAGLIVLVCVSAGWLIGWVPSFHEHLLQLHPVLISVVILGMFFASSALIKAMGSGITGLSIALAFNVCLTFLYFLYEATAQHSLTELNYLDATKNSWFYLSAAIILLTAGLLSWLTTLKLLPLPATLKHKFYVFLLNAPGVVQSGSTFTNRSSNAQDTFRCQSN